MNIIQQTINGHKSSTEHRAVSSDATVERYIQPINDIKEILPYITPNSIVMIDIDETIHRSKYYPAKIVTDAGIEAFSLIMNQSVDYKHWHAEEKNKVIKQFQEVLHEKTPVQGQDTINTIKELQKTCFVFGLTARLNSIAERTVEELKSLDLDFTTSSPFPNYRIVNNTDNALYLGGIIFTNGAQKGPIANHFLDNFVLKVSMPPPNIHLNVQLPPSVVIIDDKHDNVLSILRDMPTIHKLNIPIIAFHYTRCELEDKQYHDSNQTLSVQNVLHILSYQINFFINNSIIINNEEALLRFNQATRLHHIKVFEPEIEVDTTISETDTDLDAVIISH
jgi:hypothetical protein